MPQFNAPVPAVNGHFYSFASLEFTAFTPGGRLEIVAFKSINYGPETDASDVYGNRTQVIGQTRGRVKNTADCELYVQQWENLRTALGGVSYGDVRFNIAVSYGEVGSPVKTDRIFGARVMSTKYENADGTEAAAVKLTLHVFRIVENNTDEILVSGVG